ncbi:uncharacterized protein TRUGW13939_06860 [Talaromyces rugulosus]|uniref:AA14 family lytic polysaccharide monooxygenase A n=1 Tax=Talaromyces rugulosus TaxID=121627 RepID=LP14A_TALRU|nr:uncharacterized protein TRUGW13939_06860 [Talaromyces rugulosus]QKX59718.1 hypothetical protein TRUGW13939_06860 [Talaromyces rugulosus]
MLRILTLSILATSKLASAHVVAWHPGMYCLGGNDTSVDDPNTNLAVNPLWDLPKSKWWFQADRGCDKAPPVDGVFLELPAGQNFTTELAHNRAQTTLSFNGQYAGEWPDGKDHPEDWSGTGTPPGCIQDDGAIHTNNQTMAGGTVFAISYQSDMSQVTMENLVVFSVLEHTPWKRIATYEVPADLPPCPDAGCICAWGWVPQGCGEPNMYMAGYKCKVTGSSSTKQLAQAQVPKYCANDTSECVGGAKQILVMNQADGNNVVAPDNDFVAYNEKWGFQNGAQNDIFM